MKNVNQLASWLRTEYKGSKPKVTIESPTRVVYWMNLSFDDRGWEFTAQEIEWKLKADEGVKEYKILLNVTDERWMNREDFGIEIDVQFYGKH